MGTRGLLIIRYKNIVHYLWNSYDSMDLLDQTLKFLRYLFFRFRYQDILLILNEIEWVFDESESSNTPNKELFLYYDDNGWSVNHQSLYKIFNERFGKESYCPYDDDEYPEGNVCDGIFEINSTFNVPVYLDVFIEYNVIVDFDKHIIIDSEHEDEPINFDQVLTIEEKAYLQLFQSVIQEIKYM